MEDFVNNSCSMLIVLFTENTHFLWEQEFPYLDTVHDNINALTAVDQSQEKKVRTIRGRQRQIERESESERDAYEKKNKEEKYVLPYALSHTPYALIIRTSGIVFVFKCWLQPHQRPIIQF